MFDRNVDGRCGCSSRIGDRTIPLQAFILFGLLHTGLYVLAAHAPYSDTIPLIAIIAFMDYPVTELAFSATWLDAEKGLLLFGGLQWGLIGCAFGFAYRLMLHKNGDVKARSQK